MTVAHKNIDALLAMKMDFHAAPAYDVVLDVSGAGKDSARISSLLDDAEDIVVRHHKDQVTRTDIGLIFKAAASVVVAIANEMPDGMGKIKAHRPSGGEGQMAKNRDDGPNGGRGAAVKMTLEAA